MAESKPILIPLDGSKIAENALPMANWYSKLTGAPLKFIHVLDEDMPADERAKAAETFQGYATEMAERHGLGKVECEVLYGSAAEQVLSASVTASAIALGSRGRGGFRAMVIGSVADKIVRGSAVPVLIEPGSDEPRVPGENGTPLLVGLDGSEEAERAIALARTLAAKDHLPIVIVRTYSLPPAVGAEFATYPANVGTAMQEAAETYLHDIAKPGEKTVIQMGDPTTALLETAEAENATLIVLTSSGKGLAKRVTLGSTTDRVIHGTNRPVLVLPQVG
ncbi:MAG: universal stress protein [Dehalococcoidia bacterium]